MRRPSILLGTNVTLLTAASLVLLTACSSSVDNGSNDGGGGGNDAPAPNDSGAVPDGTTQDTSVSDSGTPDSTVTDTGSGDSGSNDGGSDASDDTQPTPPDGGSTTDGGVCATSNMVAPGKTAVAIACNQTMPANIIVSNGILYWTNYTGGGQVMSMPETGGVPTVVASNQDYPWNLTIDANNLYWTNYDGDGAESPNGAPSNSGAIFKVAINTTTGAATGTPVMLDSGLGGPWGIVVDATNVYFTTFGGNRIKSVPIAGGAETILTTVPNAGGTPMALVQDSTNLYWETENGVVASIAKTAVNGTPKLLVSANAVTGGYGLAISGSTLYFTDQSSIGHIYSLPVAGGKPPLVLASMTNTPSSLAVNGTSIYWTNYLGNGGTCTPSNGGCGELASVPIAGGAVTVDENNLDYPIGVAVDGTGVYFAASFGGRIWKVTPP